MRLRTALVVVAFALAAWCQPFHRLVGAVAAPLMTPDTLVGAWNGHWTAPPGEGTRGSLELILARVPGGDTVVGQFTFVTGATTRTLRYEGRIEDHTLRFALVGDGRIVLEPSPAPVSGAAASLHGRWVDTRGALPGPEGVLQLSRVR